MTEDENIEFTRTVGTAVHGKLTRGPPRMDAQGYKPVSSIPAKFETVLHQGPREKKGFMSNAKRFNASEHELPGPGTYHKPLAMEYNHESIGKKGYGSLASKTGRFKHKIRYTGPGPGEYKQRAPRELDEDKYFNKAHLTATFQSKLVAALTRSAPSSPPPTLDPDRPASMGRLPDKPPGPATYHAEDITRTGRKLDLLSTTASSVSAFKARERPPLLSGNTEAPPPTAYTLPDKNWEPSLMPRHSPFTVAPGRYPEPREPAPASLIFNDTDPNKSLMPGPGTYEYREVASIEAAAKKDAGKPSGAFRTSKVVDKFGHRLDGSTATRELPGPGAYFQEDGSTVAIGASSRVLPSGPAITSSFQSTTQVSAGMDSPEKMAARAPGPAFYKPSLPPGKRSFHLNAKKQYLPIT